MDCNGGYADSLTRNEVLSSEIFSQYLSEGFLDYVFKLTFDLI